MRKRQFAARRLWLLVCMFVLTSAVARAGSLSGVIRDEQGVPLQGAQVTLAPGALTTTSDATGAYRFAALPSGIYHLEVSLSGFATRQSGDLSISSTTADATMDLSMSRSPAGTASRPQFEAAGVRGLIDPGGYSAPANAAAASGLIKGIADIKRTGNDAAASPNISMSCTLEPALKKAVEDKPESADAHLRLGEFYLAHGQAAKAIPMLERAQSIDRGDPETLEQLARAYLKAERFEAAKELLTPVPPAQDGLEVHRLLARASEGLGKFSEASQQYKLAADQQPSEENLFGMGYELILAGVPKDAAAAFEAGVQRYPQSIQLLIGLGSSQFLLGHAPDSIQTLLRAVSINPADPRPYPFLVQAFGVSSDDAERVHGAFEKFLSLAPNDPRAAYDCALSLMHDPQANDSRIEQLLQHAVQLDPGLADAHYQLGVLYARRRDYQGAAQELETAIRLSPGLREAHYRLAIAYRQTGRADLSAKQMERFRETQEPSGKSASIDQFISVVAPGAKASPEVLCPGDFP
jgi:tetratricopeptide (TPR) repeat protein